MKKYMTWDFAAAVLVLLGALTVSVAFIHYSFTSEDIMSIPALMWTMRVLGFVGTMQFPRLFVDAVRDFDDDDCDMCEVFDYAEDE